MDQFTDVPVPGRPEEIVLISGASPVLDLAEAFHDIFDAVTSTFRFVPAPAGGTES
ncbi:hypothetical protein [Streptomyces sp. NPDC020917]|uniref:hypothetical protein n=1 Tax=Streptomyces sp. NPDC020917 TaxID=3365102 RepID=UPI0037AAEC2C